MGRKKNMTKSNINKTERELVNQSKLSRLFVNMTKDVNTEFQGRTHQNL